MVKINIFTNAINYCKHTIPEGILDEAFMRGGSLWRSAPTSLDSRITDNVIRRRIIPDMDIIGGQNVTIHLSTVGREYIDERTIIYNVPSELVMNRTITSVKSIGHIPHHSNHNYSSYGSSLEVTAKRLGDSVDNLPIISNARCDIIGHNTILVRDQHRINNSYVLNCVVSNEENLNNLTQRSFMAFAELVKLGVMSYIYNTLILRIDQGYIQGGQELPSFKNIVEQYSDAEERYMTYLNEVWRKVSFMNEAESYSRLIRMQICPGL